MGVGFAHTRPKTTTTHLKHKDRQLSEQHVVKAAQSDQKLNTGLEGYGNRILGRAWYFVYQLSWEGKTINSDYYMILLDRLTAKIKEKRPYMQKKKVLFHRGNARSHKSIKTMIKLN